MDRQLRDTTSDDAIAWAMDDYGYYIEDELAEVTIGGKGGWTAVVGEFDGTSLYVSATEIEGSTIVAGIEADSAEIEELAATVLVPILESITVTPLDE